MNKKKWTLWQHSIKENLMVMDGWVDINTLMEQLTNGINT
jgi:GH25 family lysozyme M1 (1,4-beta-N-acetylmuramidase)